MKIIGLKVDGFKKLSAIDMKFAEDGITFIKGDNEQGKTSIIDVIYYLFKGKSTTNDKVIQNGKHAFTAVLELEEYTIVRTKTENTDTLQITNKDGLVVGKKPQAFLDKLVNDLTFSPLPFLNKTAKQKYEFMMNFLNADSSKFDKQIENLSSERLYLHRKLKEMGIPQEPEKVERVDLRMLYQERDEIIEYNEKQDEMAECREHLHGEIYKKEQEIERLREMIDNAQKEINHNMEKLAEIPEPEEHKDKAEVEEKIKDAAETNKKAEEYDDYLEAKTNRDIVEGEYQSVSEQIINVREEKKKFFEGIDTGVEGLELRDDGIYYKGIFSENWSDSEALRISANLCAAMNPAVKAIFVDRGESFGKKRLKELEKWAIENDIQVILTKVDDNIPDDIPDNTYYIEEGRIVGGSNE